MQLSDHEIRDIIKFLEAGKPLPDEYRFKLFEDKREVELVWNGKTDEVTNIDLPFQVIEQVDEPRSEDVKALSEQQLSIFDPRGRQLSGWTNKLIWGDNKLILSSLKNGPLRREIEAQGGIKLIYIDPPFDVGADFSMNIEVGDEEFTKKPSVIEEIAYRDTWGKGADSWIAMMYERLSLMKDLLADDGSIFVHCDTRVTAYLRLILDEIFGSENFKNEISWKRGTVKGAKARGNQMARNHDTIFYYSKSQNCIFNRTYLPFSPEYASRFNKNDNDGRGPYRDDQPIGTRSQKSIEEMLKTGKMIICEDGRQKIKTYLSDLEGVVLDDNWLDISEVNVMSTERVHYPTQKPEKLLNRIIEMATNDGDIVCDFFCGSGTTLAAAEKLGRKWIGSDLGKFSIHTTRKRLINVQRQLKQEGKDFRAFEVLNLGKYERQHYIGVNENLEDLEKEKQLREKEKNFRELILQAYNGEPVEGFSNFCGKKNAHLVAIGPIDIPVTSYYVNSCIDEAIEKHITQIDILAFEFEMNLAPRMVEEAKERGVTLTLKYIPKEVFDKRAIEKNQIVFYDVAYIEVKPKREGNSKKVAIELIDFSVSYNQDYIPDIENGLKKNQEKIVLDSGQIVKIAKNESGIVKREVLTSKWSDWIDYWSVDFNYESKQEIIKVDDKEVWTGEYIFENEWQTFRTKKNKEIEFVSSYHEYEKSGKYKIAIKVVDILGNDNMKVIEINI